MTVTLELLPSTGLPQSRLLVRPRSSAAAAGSRRCEAWEAAVLLPSRRLKLSNLLPGRLMRRSFVRGSSFRPAAATIHPDGGADRGMCMTNDRSFVRSILGGGLVLLGLLPAVANSQEATTVSGRVTAAVGAAPLVGATVS